MAGRLYWYLRVSCDSWQNNSRARQYIALSASWNYQNIIATTLARFKDFIKLVGLNDPLNLHTQLKL